MKLLVSTTSTQGQRANDFCFVPEGELVHWFGLVCGKDTDGQTGVPDPDGPCGCGRSFVGLESQKGTTTARVIEVPQRDRAAVQRALALALRARMDDAALPLAAFPVGTIVERRGEGLQARASCVEAPCWSCRQPRPDTWERCPHCGADATPF